MRAAELEEIIRRVRQIDHALDGVPNVQLARRYAWTLVNDLWHQAAIAHREESEDNAYMAQATAGRIPKDDQR